MKNKGFTLIELLAVIVILAIIALIATPIILGIIDDARQSAKENSAKYIVSTLETSYATAYMKSYTAGSQNSVTVTAKGSGELPTINHVLAEMSGSIENATVDVTNSKITGSDGVVCNVTTTSNVLGVKCYVDQTAATAGTENTEIAKNNNTSMTLKVAG